MKLFKHKEVIGDCTLYLGDAYEILPLLGRMDACVMDPPYEFDASGGGIFRNKRRNMDEIQAARLDKGFDHTAFTSAQFGSVVMFCHNDQLMELLGHIQAQWGKYAVCSWHKTNPMPVANKHYRPDTEFYIHGWRAGFHPVGELVQKARYILSPNGQDKEIPHPTVKPLGVMDKILSNVNGAMVCDPFMGSGTTGIACLKAGKGFVGIERDDRFFELAAGRLHAAYAQMDMFMPLSKGSGTMSNRQEILI